MSKKITDLTALTTPDSTDVIPVVDLSANTTKKTTVAGIIEAAPDTSIPSEKLESTVSFHATTTQSGFGSGFADITTYTEVHDYGSDFNHTTGVFTAPYNGSYHFDATVGDNNVNSRCELSLLVNAVEKDHGFSFGSAANHDPRARVGITIALTAGDTVKLQAWTEAGSSALDAPSFFSGFLVGRV